MEIKGMAITGLTEDELAIAMAAAERAVKADREQKAAEAKLNQIKELVNELEDLGYYVEGYEIGGCYESRRNKTFTAKELKIHRSRFK